MGIFHGFNYISFKIIICLSGCLIYDYKRYVLYISSFYWANDKKQKTCFKFNLFKPDYFTDDEGLFIVYDGTIVTHFISECFI